MDENDPHGFGPPTPTDHRSWIWVAALLSFVYSGLSLGARFIAKWELLSYDDVLLGIGYLLAICHHGLLYSAISNGLGASTAVLRDSELQKASEHYFAARVFLILALCFSKASVLVFTRRIFSGNIYKERLFFYAGYSLIGIWGLSAVMLSSIGCHPDRILIANENAVCGANAARWKTITTLDVATEIVILALPVWFISKNRIKLSKKAVVIFLFSFRLVAAVLSIATTVSYFNFLHGTQDSIGLAPTVSWQEALLSSSLVTASIPCLRHFLWAFMSRGLKTMYGVTSAGDSRTGTIHLRSFNKSATSRHDFEISSEATPSRVLSGLRPERVKYSVDVRRAPNKQRNREDLESQSVESDGSEEMIIRRHVEVEIHSELA